MIASPRWSMLLPLLLSAGCGPASAVPVEPPASTPEAGSRFDPTSCGRIEGRVAWTGDIPIVQPFTILPVTPALDMKRERQVRDNEHRPAIDPFNRGVGSAVVFLRGLDPARGRPWDHEPAVVELRDYRFDVRQNDRRGRYGFVRRGKVVEMVSRQPILHTVHAAGAAYFTLPFPGEDQPAVRRLERNGVIELSSATTYFWMRAYLFVDDHPYYACTEADGRFVLDDVPDGTYELACWMPNWHEAGRDLDPELGIVLRLFFRPPLEVVQTVRVKAGEVSDVRFTLSADQFRR